MADVTFDSTAWSVGMTVELDHRVRRSRNGTVLLGGQPLRVMTLSERGGAALDRINRGDEPRTPAERSLVARVHRAGLAIRHPRPASAPHDTVAVVLPALDPPPTFDRTLRTVAAARPAMTVVVDDGSATPVSAPDASVIRHDRPLGPAAAREAGWRSTDPASTEIIVFLDADVSPAGDWLSALVGHFAESDVVAVAPRVRSAPGEDLISRYEEVGSPLDLGDRYGVVGPGRSVPYVPTAALAVRRSALEEVGGFDTGLRTGEDVDLIWRLVAGGGTVVYDPRIQCEHLPRPSLTAWLRQRRSYGRSAGPLADRHGATVAPLALSPTAFGVIIGLVGGRRTAPLAAAAAGLSVVRVSRTLGGVVDQPIIDAARLTLSGTAHAVRSTVSAVRRAWLPLAVGAAIPSKRARRLLAAVLVGPAIVSWLRSRPRVGLGVWTVMSALDDAAYCRGVWEGALATRSPAALLPRIGAAAPSAAAGR